MLTLCSRNDRLATDRETDGPLNYTKQLQWIFKGYFKRPVLWHSGLSCHLQSCQLTRTLVQVPAATLHVQFPANVPVKAGDELSAWTPATLVGDPDADPGSRFQAGPAQHSEKDLSLSPFLCNSASQINKYMHLHC